MNKLLWLAALAIGAWLVLRVLGFVAAMLFKFLWVVALVLVAVWLVRKVTAHRRARQQTGSHKG